MSSAGPPGHDPITPLVCNLVGFKAKRGHRRQLANLPSSSSSSFRPSSTGMGVLVSRFVGAGN